MKFKLAALMGGMVMGAAIASAAMAQTTPTFDPSSTVLGRTPNGDHAGGYFVTPQGGDYGNVDTDCPSGVCRAWIPTFSLYQPTYQLLGVRSGAGGTVTGTAQGPVKGATYIHRIMGTFGGCTWNFQVLDADGVTWLTILTGTAANTAQVTIGAAPYGSAANVREQLTGCTGGQALWATLS